MPEVVDAAPSVRHHSTVRLSISARFSHRCGRGYDSHRGVRPVPTTAPPPPASLRPARQARIQSRRQSLPVSPGPPVRGSQTRPAGRPRPIVGPQVEIDGGEPFCTIGRVKGEAQQSPQCVLTGGYMALLSLKWGSGSKLAMKTGHGSAKCNWPSRIRTWINGSKVRCPAIGRRASNRSQFARAVLPMVVVDQGPLQRLTRRFGASSGPTLARRESAPTCRPPDPGRGGKRLA